MQKELIAILKGIFGTIPGTTEPKRVDPITRLAR